MGLSYLAQQNSLAEELAIKILDDIEHHALVADTRLVERKLAEQFKVSRSPIRSALKLLEERGVVHLGVHGGYLVSERVKSYVKSASQQTDDSEALYFLIAKARLSGELADRVSENEILRRFSLTKGQLAPVLRRIAGEGWIERLPGHGWEFQPALTSLAAYRDSYRFRLTIEPAAILEPDFTLNRPVLETRLKEQQQLADGLILTVSSAELFNLNSLLHENIVECSGNVFFVEALRRVNRLRRLMEYQQALERDKALQRVHEHIALLNMLLEGKNREAAKYLRQHLQSVSALKTCDKV